jgi:hypothetical protein
MSTATCDQPSGAITSRNSKTTDPSGLRITELLGAKLIPVKGSCPSRVNRRLMCTIGLPVVLRRALTAENPERTEKH